MGNPPLTKALLSGVRPICLSSWYQSQPSSPPGCWAGPPFSSGVEGECCRVPYRQGALGLCTLLVMANPPLTRALLSGVRPFVFLLCLLPPINVVSG
jgi:hypothetical protein